MDETTPTGIALTPFDERFREDPHAVLDEVRRKTPAIMYDDAFKQWFVTRHDDVKQILRDRDMSSDPRKAEEGSFVRMFVADGEVPSMLFLDDPDHRRLRGLVNKAFTPKAVERMRMRIREIADDLLDEVDADEFDLMSALAAPLPVIVIAEMLGIDANDHARFKACSDVWVSAFFNPFKGEEEQAAANSAQAELEELFRQQIAARRVRSNEDLIGAMVTAEEAGDSLNDDEIVGQCNLLLVAGNVTTTDLIGNGVKALLGHPDQLAKLRSKPELIERAVEEMLRYDTPVTQSGRVADREMAIEGCPIHRGQSVSVSLAAANHDPDVYDDPHRFDIEREDVHHQAFGGGRHFCLGAPLARVETQEAMNALLHRYPKLAVSPRGYSYRTIPGFRGMTELWLTVS